MLQEGLRNRSEGLQLGQVLCTTWTKAGGLNIMRAALKTSENKDMYSEDAVDFLPFMMGDLLKEVAIMKQFLS
jgi:hypothetical protein